jgi:hypothetical protein
MMNVPVHDRNAPNAVLLLRVPGSDRNIIEEAESHDGRALGVVTRRSNGAESALERSAQNIVNGLRDSSCREQCDRVRIAAHVSISRVKDLFSRAASIPDRRNILFGMRERQELFLCGYGNSMFEPRPDGGVQEVTHERLQSLRPFGMALSGVVE